jgi:N4-gp56 family major capsid protein
MDWTFATGNALTRKAWAKKWWMEAKTLSYFYENGFVGTSSENIIVEFPDLEKDKGDVIYLGQIRELSGAGVANDAQMEDAEEVPPTYDNSVTLTQIRNAVRTAGREMEMRPSDNAIREYAKELLRRWMAAKIDQDIFTAIGASPTKIIYGGDATLTTDVAQEDYMTLSLIAKCAVYARKAQPKIVGPTVKGKQTNGVIVLSEDQAYDVTERDASWNQSRMEAAVSGTDNPLFTGALGMKNLIPIHSHPRVASVTTWGGGAIPGATALFMGIQAGAIAYSTKKIWEEKTFDYQNKVGFCIGSIYGVSKSVFNSADISVVAVRTSRTNN